MFKTIPKPVQKMKVAKGQIFKYHNPEMNYSMDIELCDSIYKTTYDGKFSISKHNFRICRWVWNEVPFADKNGNEYSKEQQVKICQEERALLEIFIGINKSTGIDIPDKPESQIIIGEGGALEDLLK
jgi:prolyl-tRNA synthetase